ncbi:MAG: hypothetical protein H7338_01310 [Candidatus Sericytochromatia bacterium]|nr:hypothetical protein [Candidatus Sericytochromatia bacterium]
MILYVSIGIVIGLLVGSAVAWMVFAAIVEKRALMADEYKVDLTDPKHREMGPVEQGTQAVIQQRYVAGEIDQSTLKRQTDELHHPEEVTKV